MRINDNGFTERVATPSTPTSGVGSANQRKSLVNGSTSDAGDNLQLSGFAARLNSGSNTDASNRADRVSQMARAVNDGTFQIDASRVSGALISEALKS
jgi:flagellar biosynthesis anti-sigma factor FlgM